MSPVRWGRRGIVPPMPRRLLVAAAALAAVAVAFFANARRLLNTRGAVARTTIRSPEEHTTTDLGGAVRSVQAADVDLSARDADSIWTPMHLERLARTYWRFLTRITFGAVRVRYREDGRDVCLFGVRRLPLLTFQAPEYEMDDHRGIVRWRIEKGLLVAREGRGGKGYLEIDARRYPAAPGRARLHVEVEVANFYPTLAFRFGRWFYANTQSRIHVIVTHAFLRSLARLNLAESQVGALEGVEDVFDPGTVIRT
jgi:hypothetical protein